MLDVVVPPDQVLAHFTHRNYDTLGPIPNTAERTGPRLDEFLRGRDIVAFVAEA